jgi:MOSC domain-containing protein YiiM
VAKADFVKYVAGQGIRQTAKDRRVARIESVNVGHERRFDNNTGATGIYKAPVEGGAFVGALGVEGDCVADQENHGGRDQAVYCYLAEDYAWWSERLGTRLPPGTFGDNVTVSGLDAAELAAGDRLVAGEVTLEFTAPRIPCSTLARRMEDSGFVKAFRAAGRPGIYCRVIEPGMLRAGTEAILRKHTGPRVTIMELFNAWFERRKLSPEALQRMLRAPIAIRVREDFEALLAAAREGVVAQATALRRSRQPP